MYKQEIKTYLSYKRKFSTQRVIAINIISIMAFIGSVVTMIINQFILVAILVSCISIILTFFSISLLVKSKSKESTLYLSSSTTFLHIYFIFGVMFYLFVIEYINVYVYLFTFIVFSAMMLSLSFLYIKKKVELKIMPKRAYSELFWFLVIVSVLLIPKSVFGTVIFDNGIFKISFVVLWILIGTYTVADIYLNSRLYSELE